MTLGFRVFGWDAMQAHGRDTAEWLGGIVTSDLPSAERDARWGLLLSKQGKIQAELLIIGGASGSLSIVVRGGDAAAVHRVFDHHLVMEDVELGLVERQAWALVLGATDEEVAALRASGLEPIVAPFGTDVGLLVRGGSVGELSSLLATLGRPLADGEWEQARIELGLPAFGIDFGDGDNPHQAALERRAVSWKKGCYLGQEVVFMQDARGKVKRRLVRLRAPTGETISRAARVQDASGADVGEVTTGAAGVAFARVQAPHFEPGTSLTVGQTPVLVDALDAGLFGRTGPAGRVPA